MGRRTETTEYLMECIADALLDLMKKMPIDKIKIQEITDLAGVGRMTYFRYFHSKSEVLIYKMKLLWHNWAQMNPYPHEGSLYEQTLWFFRFCQSIQPVLLILGKQGQYEALLSVLLIVAAPMETAYSHSGYLKMYAAYGMLGVMIAWIQNNFKETPEELARICVK